jgi:hypothetical protein
MVDDGAYGSVMYLRSDSYVGCEARRWWAVARGEGWMAGPGDPGEGEIGWVVVVQPNVPKQTGTNESCDSKSSPSRPKWTIVQVVVPEDELGSLSMMRPESVNGVYPTSAVTQRSDQVAMLRLRSSFGFVSTPVSTTRLQFDKGAGYTLS